MRKESLAWPTGIARTGCRRLAASRARSKSGRVDRTGWAGDPAAMVLLRSRPAVPLLALALLAGCGGGSSGSGTVRSTGTPPTKPSRAAVRPPQRHIAPPPLIQTLPGVAGVIGATPGELIRQFGAPRLDVQEGDARKLQFAAVPCVLDVYLYPPAPGREAQATYVDARRASDAQEVDRATCIAALRRQPAPGTNGSVTRP